MYKIKMHCFDPDNHIHEYEPAFNVPYDTAEEAYKYALELANDEIEYLNIDCDDGVSFGIVEENENNIVRVLYYYIEDEYDTTGNTEQVTTYYVVPVNAEEDCNGE